MGLAGPGSRDHPEDIRAYTATLDHADIITESI
jgi:hypothetical protein